MRDYEKTFYFLILNFSQISFFFQTFCCPLMREGKVSTEFLFQSKIDGILMLLHHSNQCPPRHKLEFYLSYICTQQMWNLFFFYNMKQKVSIRRIFKMLTLNIHCTYADGRTSSFNFFRSHFSVEQQQGLLSNIC